MSLQYLFFGVTLHIPLLPFQVYGSHSMLSRLKVLILPKICIISMQKIYIFIKVL